MTTFTPITLNADALSLVTQAGLPVADLEDGMSRLFGWGYEEDDRVGVVGICPDTSAFMVKSLQQSSLVLAVSGPRLAAEHAPAG